MFKLFKSKSTKRDSQTEEVDNPNKVQMKGDLAIRPFRRATKDARKKKERDAFDAKLKEIKKGYKSKKVCNGEDNLL